MPGDLSTGIALCGAWESGDIESWTHIARRNGAHDGDATIVALAELSHVAAELARALAAAEGQLVDDILSQLSLQNLNDVDDERLELYRGFSRVVDVEPSPDPL